jgi:hypothetical protein
MICIGTLKSLIKRKECKIVGIPEELIEIIISFLDIKDISKLLQTCRGLFKELSPRLKRCATDSNIETLQAIMLSLSLENPQYRYEKKDFITSEQYYLMMIKFCRTIIGTLIMKTDTIGKLVNAKKTGFEWTKCLVVHSSKINSKMLPIISKNFPHLTGLFFWKCAFKRPSFHFRYIRRIVVEKYSTSMTKGEDVIILPENVETFSLSGHLGFELIIRPEKGSQLRLNYL